MKSSVKKVVIAVIVIAAFVGVCVLLSMRGIEDFHSKYAGVDLNVGIEGLEREGTYTGYINAHANDAVYPSKDVEIDIFKYTSEGNVEVAKNIEGVEKSLYTDTASSVTFNVNVPETGFYNVYMEYLIPASRGVAAERAIKINGEYPFNDAVNIEFTRIWTNDGDPIIDNQGNEIRPSQIEVYDWQSAYFKDDMGYVQDPYTFWLEKGENQITLDAENEPMYIKKLEIRGIRELDSYADYIAKQPSANASGNAKNYKVVIQGEDSTVRSDSSLYAKYDRSSPTTVPNSVTTTVLNYVGGDAWKSSGQWIEWDFEVPEDGYYNIMIKGRQNYQRGAVSSRAVLIDGEIPFKEMKTISFDYANDWECKDLADEDGNKYDFYLTKGKHTIRLEAVLGGIGPILQQLEDSTFRLNQIYRKILVYTGANPDQYRDYNIDKNYPEVMEAMDLESKRLFKLVDDTVAVAGQKADNIATAQTVAQQMERFCKKPNKISLEFITFKDNITAIGTASLNMSETKLDVDYLVVSGTDVSYKHEKANPITKLWHETKSFIASFFVDYNSVGNVYDEDGKSNDIIKVWVTTGRDQGTILKTIIDDSFTPQTGIKVNVEIVDPNSLLNAVLAGRGPDVVLSVGSNLPVDYALRKASVDITQFPDYKEVLSHYTPSSYKQYELDGGIYGVPETQTFSVMFYRTDVLEELGLGIPQTWKELVEMLPTIQGNNLTVGLPSAAGSSSSAAASTAIASVAPDLNMYFTLLYQYGGDMYNENGTKTTVDNEAGIKAFDDYMKYFNDFGLPVYFDGVSRFRSGEMPLLVAPYSTYNTLVVSAPEIRGLWDFTVIPGTERVNEAGEKYIDRSDFIAGAATMMIEKNDDTIRKNSWEFMKWWASVDTQVRFGREIEALLGSSARYATANIDAFSQLSWSYKDIQVLTEQWRQTVGIREVPGGYFTGRHIANACRKVFNDKDDTRETIIDYSIKIDDEIKKKRKEFGMPLE